MKKIKLFEEFFYNDIDDIYEKSLNDNYWKNISDKFPDYNDSNSKDCKDAVSFIFNNIINKYKLDLNIDKQKELKNKILDGLT